MLADHGTGKSDEGLSFEKHMHAHHKDLKNIIVMDMDDSNLTEHQLLASADSIVMKGHHKA